MASSTLDYVTQKLLASTHDVACVIDLDVSLNCAPICLANSHRLFIITDDPFSAVPHGLSGNLRGVISMVDGTWIPRTVAPDTHGI